MTRVNTREDDEETTASAVDGEEPAQAEAEDAFVETSGGDGADGDPARETAVRAEAPRDRVRTALVVALVGAFLAGALGFYQWHRLSGDESIERAEARDAILAAAEQHIVTLTTLDHAELEAGLQAWLDATTGTMHTDIDSIDEEGRELVRSLRRTTTSQILALAVTDYDAAARNATVIAAVETTVRFPGEDDEIEESVDRYRYEAVLVEVDGRWLIESLEQLTLDLGLPPGEDEAWPEGTEDEPAPQGDEE